MAGFHVDSSPLLVPCHKGKRRLCKRTCSDATCAYWKSEDSKLYHDQYRDPAAIFSGPGIFWTWFIIHCSCSSFGLINVSLSLQAHKEPDTGICMESIQGHSTVSCRNIYRISTRCLILLPTNATFIYSSPSCYQLRMSLGVCYQLNSAFVLSYPGNPYKAVYF